MPNNKSCRYCFVPLCTNTTKKTPDKIFVSVPQDEKRRNLWFQAVHRDNPKSKSNYDCCEDHFDLKEDMYNYTYYKTMGGHVRMKPDVVPHKFNCQPNHKPQGTTTILRPAAEKKRRQQYWKNKKSRDAFEQGTEKGPAPVVGPLPQEDVMLTNLEERIAALSDEATAIDGCSKLEPEDVEEPTSLLKEVEIKVPRPKRYAAYSSPRRASPSHPPVDPLPPRLPTLPPLSPFPTQPSTLRKRRCLASERPQLAESTPNSSNQPEPEQDPKRPRTEFTATVDRFLTMEEHQLELQRNNARLMETLLERSAEREKLLLEYITSLSDKMAERDRLLADALRDGFKVLAQALQQRGGDKT